MAGILWAILVVVLIVWALGFFVAAVGDIIHLLLIVAAIVLIYNLLVGSRRTL